MHRHSTPGAIAAELKGPKKSDGHGFTDQAVFLRRYATGLVESFFKTMKRECVLCRPFVKRASSSPCPEIPLAA